MKRIITAIPLLLAACIANAQDYNTEQHYPGIDREYFRICSTIFVVFLFMIFIVTILKHVLEFRLKNKIVDKGISDGLASSILQTNSKDDRHATIKWFAILAGTGLGLIIVNYNLPLGIHSLAIMSLSISLSFLGYFFYLKRSGI